MIVGLFLAAIWVPFGPGGAPKAEVTGKDWVGPKVENAYPLRAYASGREGWAVIECLVQADRRLEPCEVVKEKPASLGFGAAALRMHTGLMLQSDDTPPGETVTFPVFFCKDVLSSCGRASTRYHKAIEHRDATGKGEVPAEPDWTPR
jgi:hypothetical protein